MSESADTSAGIGEQALHVVVDHLSLASNLSHSAMPPTTSGGGLPKGVSTGHY